MSENQSTRRKFLQFLGLSASATIVSSSVLAKSVESAEIVKLNPEQQEFMVGYGKWMDEFIEVIRIQKTDPGNKENNSKMIALTHRSEESRPKLTEYMKDPAFSVIYKIAIERMSKEI